MSPEVLPDDRQADVEAFVSEWVTDNRIPGASVAIVDGDDLVYAEGFGARALDENEPATPRTLFGVASCTKSFTAAAVMQLAHRGELSVEDQVNDFLPHLSDAPGDPITVRELLTHTSGLPAHPHSSVLPGENGLDHLQVPLSSTGDFRRHVQGALDRRVTDRDTFLYYNAGYTMLAQIVEAISGQPIAEYVDEHVLTPLGMDRSTFSRDEFEAVDDRMVPYLEDGTSATPSAFPFDEFMHGPAGLLSPVDEMATWVRALMNGGTYDGTTVLDPASVDEMTTPVSTMYTAFNGQRLEYGYGLMIQDVLGDRLVGHGGSIGVSNAYFGYLEDAELGVAIACSTRPEAHVMSVGAAILALLRGQAPEDVVPHYELVSALDRVSGEYAGYPDVGDVSVERDGGLLRLTEDYGSGGDETILMPDRVTNDLLVCKRTDVDGFEHEARFEFDDDGVTLFFKRDRYRKLS